jgi:hypothetical protein
MNIYQAIWEADQTGSGVRPVLEKPGERLDEQQGYVKVVTETGLDDDGDIGDTKVLPAAYIPPAKERTYKLVRTLFDNYALDEQDAETETPREREEVHELLAAVVDTPPMLVARQYVEEATGTAISNARWYATLLEMWFRTFEGGGDPDLSGFEHVFVGEQQGPKVQGYHFWYKYFLDDGMAPTTDMPFPGFRNDRIVYVRGLHQNGQEKFPESVTISYKWTAPDYDRQKLRPLFKTTGGFFVGCSVEGLMALGTVRSHLGARAPKEAIINGARYDLKLFRSQNNQHIRTFYPVYLGPNADVPSEPSPRVPTEPIGNSKLRILAALVNPVGPDQGEERIIVANAGQTNASLANCTLRDAERNRLPIPAAAELVPAGASVTISLPKGSFALTNKGGQISLLDAQGRLLHRVSYSKAQARIEGQLIYF